MLVNMYNENENLIGVNTEYIKYFEVEINNECEKYLKFNLVFTSVDDKKFKSNIYWINKIDLNLKDLEKGFEVEFKKSLLNCLLERVAKCRVSHDLCEDIYVDCITNLSCENIARV